jgi:glycosyltransferase involved in cell wall biosynthesis
MFAEAIGWPDPTSEFYRTARMMEETCLRRADAVYSSSRCSAEWCQRHYGLDSTRIPIIHTGIDTNTFRPLPVTKAENPTVIFVGKIERNKGAELLVEAACELRREIPDLRLRLIGRGNADLIESLKEMAYAADAPQLIDFVGFVPHDQLPDHLSRAHVFAAPSQYEGGPGFVYLEAMACGLPVIACSGSGASEVVASGETGLLVSPHGRNALVQALNLLLTDVQLRNQLGVNACEYVTRYASRETCLTSLEDFYLSILAGRRHEEAVHQCQ